MQQRQSPSGATLSTTLDSYEWDEPIPLSRGVAEQCTLNRNPMVNLFVNSNEEGNFFTGLVRPTPPEGMRVSLVDAWLQTSATALTAGRNLEIELYQSPPIGGTGNPSYQTLFFAEAAAIEDNTRREVRLADLELKSGTLPPHVFPDDGSQLTMRYQSDGFTFGGVSWIWAAGVRWRFDRIA